MLCCYIKYKAKPTLQPHLQISKPTLVHVPLNLQLPHMQIMHPCHWIIGIAMCAHANVRKVIVSKVVGGTKRMQITY